LTPPPLQGGLRGVEFSDDKFLIFKSRHYTACGNSAIQAQLPGSLLWLVTWSPASPGAGTQIPELVEAARLRGRPRLGQGRSHTADHHVAGVQIG
jgi:hypothetical protein